MCSLSFFSSFLEAPALGIGSGRRGSGSQLASPPRSHLSTPRRSVWGLTGDHRSATVHWNQAPLLCCSKLCVEGKTKWKAKMAFREERNPFRDAVEPRVPRLSIDASLSGRLAGLPSGTAQSHIQTALWGHSSSRMVVFWGADVNFPEEERCRLPASCPGPSPSPHLLHTPNWGREEEVGRG